MTLKERIAATQNGPPEQLINLINPILDEAEDSDYWQLVALSLEELENHIKRELAQPASSDHAMHAAGKLAAVEDIRLCVLHKRVPPQPSPYGD